MNYEDYAEMYVKLIIFIIRQLLTILENLYHTNFDEIYKRKQQIKLITFLDMCGKTHLNIFGHAHIY